MALKSKRNTKIIYTTGSGNTNDKFFINAATEASASASYASGTHTKFPETINTFGHIYYQLKLIDEDMEEIRRFATGSGEINVDGGSF